MCNVLAHIYLSNDLLLLLLKSFWALGLIEKYIFIECIGWINDSVMFNSRINQCFEWISWMNDSMAHSLRHSPVLFLNESVFFKQIDLNEWFNDSLIKIINVIQV